MKLLKILLTFILALTITACGNEANSEEEVLKGTVVNVDNNNILMDSTEHGLVSFMINDETEFEEGVSKDITIGNYMELEYEGALAESYPYQISGEFEVMKNDMQTFPKGLTGYFEGNDVVTVNRLDDKDAILYSRDFDFCAQALEKVYEDEDGTYYLPCMSSQNYAVYANGEFMSLVDAFEKEVIHPMDVTEYINIQDESEAVSK